MPRKKLRGSATSQEQTPASEVKPFPIDDPDFTYDGELNSTSGFLRDEAAPSQLSDFWNERNGDSGEIILKPELIKDLLRKGHKLAIHAPSKSFKTWLMAQLMMCLSHGIPFLGMTTTETPICYWDMELYEEEFRLRQHTIASALNVNPEHNFYRLHFRGRLEEGTIKNIRQYALERRGRFGVICIDPIYKLGGDDFDENSTGSVIKLLKPFEKLCFETGSALVYCHHQSKGNQAGKDELDRSSGAGGWGRDPDCIITLTEHQKPDCYTCGFRLRSFKKIPPIVIRWNFPLFEIEPDEDPEAIKLPKPVRKVGRPEKSGNIFRTVELTGEKGASIADLMEACELGRTQVFNRLKVLIAQGLIAKNSDLKYVALTKG